MIQTNVVALERLRLTSLILSPMGDISFLHLPVSSLIFSPMGEILPIGYAQYMSILNIANKEQAVINRNKGQKGYEKE
jgi:hypothetical protein